jgi:AcrR family transcriptional regulator
MPAARTARTPSRLSGRRAEAARNDEKILAAAREVFIADPTAPITAVARQAGVGISALYSRYGSKEELLRTLCHDGLALFVAETEAALADTRGDWVAFTDYMRRLVDADTSSMTLALAGTFTPTEEMFALAERANALLERFYQRVRHVLRNDVEVHDLSLIFELVAAIRVGDPDRTRELRRRYLAVVLDGLQAGAGECRRLPAAAPSWSELNQRWVT